MFFNFFRLFIEKIEKSIFGHFSGSSSFIHQSFIIHSFIHHHSSAIMVMDHYNNISKNIVQHQDNNNNNNNNNQDNNRG